MLTLSVYTVSKTRWSLMTANLCQKCAFSLNVLALIFGPMTLKMPRLSYGTVISFMKIVPAFRRQVSKCLPRCLFDHTWSRCDLDLWPFDLKKSNLRSPLSQMHRVIHLVSDLLWVRKRTHAYCTDSPKSKCLRHYSNSGRSTKYCV